MVGWMDDEALRRTLTTGRVTFWSRSPPGVLAQGRHLRPRPVGARRWPRLRRRRPARRGRPGRRGVPHRRARPASTRSARCRSSSAAGSSGDGGRETHRLTEPAAPQHALVAPDLTWARPGPTSRRSAPWPPTAGSSRWSGGCWPTARRRSGSTASSPRTRPGTFLLESAEHGGVWSRYSHRRRALRRATLTARDGEARLARRRRRSACRPTGDPLTALRDTVAALRDPARLPGLPPLTGGLVGATRLGRRPPLGARCPTPARRRPRAARADA